MHAEAMNAVRRMMVTSHFTRNLSMPSPEQPRFALDLGGADVNGTARDLFNPHTTWFGLDIEPGPGVDIVADARHWDGSHVDTTGGMVDWSGRFDLVLCTELLEHVNSVRGVLETIHRVLKPGGYVFLTCASTGRRPHGARGAADPTPGEFYQNVDPIKFDQAMANFQWSDGDWPEYNPNPGDLYAWMRK